MNITLIPYLLLAQFVPKDPITELRLRELAQNLIYKLLNHIDNSKKIDKLHPNNDTRFLITNKQLIMHLKLHS